MNKRQSAFIDVLKRRTKDTVGGKYIHINITGIISLWAIVLERRRYNQRALSLCKKKKRTKNYYYHLRVFLLFPPHPSVLTAIVRSPKSGGNFGARYAQGGGARKSRGDPISVPVEALFPLLSLRGSSRHSRRDSPRTTMASALAFPVRVCERGFSSLPFVATESAIGFYVRV